MSPVTSFDRSICNTSISESVRKPPRKTQEKALGMAIGHALMLFSSLQARTIAALSQFDVSGNAEVILSVQT